MHSTHNSIYSLHLNSVPAPTLSARPLPQCKNMILRKVHKYIFPVTLCNKWTLILAKLEWSFHRITYYICRNIQGAAWLISLSQWIVEELMWFEANYNREAFKFYFWRHLPYFLMQSFSKLQVGVKVNWVRPLRSRDVGFSLVLRPWFFFEVLLWINACLTSTIFFCNLKYILQLSLHLFTVN